MSVVNKIIFLAHIDGPHNASASTSSAIAVELEGRSETIQFAANIGAPGGANALSSPRCA